MIPLALLLLVIGGLALTVLAFRPAASRIADAWAIRVQSIAVGLAVAAAAAASGYFLIVPTYSSISTSVGSGTIFPSNGREGRTLLAVNGLDALPALIVPVLLAAVPLLARRPVRRRRLCAIAGTLLALFCFLAGFSIGLAYVPSAALLLIAAASGLELRPAA